MTLPGETAVGEVGGGSTPGALSGDREHQLDLVGARILRQQLGS
jgi:hypothetical protein